MAAQRYIVPFYADITLVSATDCTLVQIVAPTNTALRIVGYNVSFTGAADTDPQIKLQIAVQTTAGTGGASVTPNNLDTTSSVAAQTTAAAATTAYSVQPTTTANSARHVNGVHQKGSINKLFADAERILVAGGTRMALQANPGTTASTIKARGHLIFEE